MRAFRSTLPSLPAIVLIDSASLSLLRTITTMLGDSEPSTACKGHFRHDTAIMLPGRCFYKGWYCDANRQVHL